MKKNIKKSVPYEVGLYKSLRNLDEAMGYINAAFQDGDKRVFLLALYDVLKAHDVDVDAKTNACCRKESI